MSARDGRPGTGPTGPAGPGPGGPAGPNGPQPSGPQPPAPDYPPPPESFALPAIPTVPSFDNGPSFAVISSGRGGRPPQVGDQVLVIALGPPEPVGDERWTFPVPYFAEGRHRLVGRVSQP